ncbi:MAG: response regulator receiver sensor signal transduction histidine kinase [Candidatus Magnetoglobus multicellularis str. Araruama]|uniref:histidine kinase n=1 Tax=Candidatus Magnetoglobus multicellularis str. Araruama TaxID=890399 RepID=A0A1V1NTU4_9BACT|nr:MAG: response regulator receiver sensor signal transduction histidine kinase [Candidatus Magnetoglobus multicellularis str. Araruama]
METSENATIMVVDDNPTNLRVLIDYLEESGYETMVAPSGERAIQQLEHAKPDLILLDIMMPGLDGFETCKQLKENDDVKEIPVIFMTALSDTEKKLKGFHMGAVDYITKPFQQEEVLARINTHLIIQRQKKELLLLNDKLSESNRKLTETNIQLSRVNSELTTAIETREKIFSVFSDDLFGSMGSIFGLSGRIVRSAENLLNETFVKTAVNIQRSASYTQRIIENLLGWIKIQSGSIDLSPDIIPLHKIVERCTIPFNQQAEDKRITIKNNIIENELVYVDENMTDAIFQHILGNAVKYCLSGDTITISSKNLGDYEEIKIIDSGIGISEENQRKLFKINSTVKENGTAGEKGAGLGLIICKELIKKLNGKIWITSQMGKGTTVSITLPKHRRCGMLGDITHEDLP